ncbi:MAG TPA: 50S ribosomal protein L29 [Cytophagales bacterium]|nr:50S ribosomal protein L29 [Cytophagales bacterium]
MKNSEIAALTVEEIKEKLASEKEALTKLKFAHAITPIENPMKIKETRRVIARLNGELRSKELSK